MKTKTLGRRVLALAAVGCALFPVATASAQDDPVPITSGAGADWGVKASFRSYVVGPIAHGAIAVSGGATVNADGTYHFPVKGGVHDPVTGATVVELAGAVHFTGHAGQLDLKIANPRIELTADGSFLYADVASKTSLEATEITPFPNVQISSIDLADKTPAVAGGKTTWTALPQALTAAGAPAFAGFYASGTALDPVSFGYDGPGGRPLIESWSLPGVPQFDRVSTGSVTAGTLSLGFDPARGRVWTANNSPQRATVLNQSDLTQLGTVSYDFDHWPRSVAVDRSTGDAFTVDGEIKRITESGGVFSVSATPLDTFTGGATNALDSTPDGTLWTVKDDQLISYKGGVRTAYTLPQTYDALQVLDDGQIFVYAQFASRAIGKVALTGTTATVTDIPGTEGAEPGFTADGSFYYVEQDYSEYPKVTRRLWSLKQTASGYERAQVPGIATGIGGFFIAVAGDGKTVYVGNESSTGLSVIRDGKLIDTITPDGTLSDIATSPDGDVYAIWRNGKLARLGQVGTTPAFTTQPRDAAVFAGAAATFSAAASEDATLKWQTRAPGATRWVDAAAGATLTLAAPVAGVRVRAIAANTVGTVASAVAAVTIKPPVVEDPPANGDDGTTTPPPVQAAPSPTPTVVPAPPARAASLTAPKTAKVSTKRVATVLSLTCGSAACTITAPRTVKVKVGGRTYTATVAAPKTLAAGKRGSVRVKLPAAAYRALRGRRTTAKVKVVLTADGKRTTRTASVSLRR